MALFADAVLVALLGGILAGMAVATLLSAARLAAQERSERVRFYGELAGRRLFVEERS